MNINERIKNIEKYFKSLNMVDGAVVVLVKFPDKWKVFNKEEISNEFKVDVGKKDGVDGIFFVGEIADGLDNVFDAIDEVINQNKTFEEKAALLEIKAKELSDLFITEPLEKLKTLQFTFTTKKPLKKAKNAVKEEANSSSVEVDNRKEEIVEQEVVEKPKSAKQTKKQPKNDGDSDVMSFMKEITEGGKK